MYKVNFFLGQTELRKKASTSVNITTNYLTKKKSTGLRRSNSASKLLGLTLLIFPDKEEYGISMNNYEGFKVNIIQIRTSLWYEVNAGKNIFPRSWSTVL